MRCLHCNHDPVPSAAEVCPRCGVHMASMLRDMLPAGTLLHDGKYRLDYALRRGVREGRVLARLDHPSVVRVRDLFEERGTAYLVMDLVQGKSLREVLD